MLAKAMEESRSIPTATSFRILPVDTLEAKRKAFNGALETYDGDESRAFATAHAAAKQADEKDEA